MFSGREAVVQGLVRSEVQAALVVVALEVGLAEAPLVQAQLAPSVAQPGR